MILPDSYTQEKTSLIDYIVYNSEGKILRTGKCSYKDLSIIPKENEFIIEGVANDTVHCIDILTKEIISKSKSILDAEKAEKESFNIYQLKRDIISAKIEEILLRMAVEELQKEGKLDKNGNLKS
jgi:hypothetical protein